MFWLPYVPTPHHPNTRIIGKYLKKFLYYIQNKPGKTVLRGSGRITAVIG